jgi:hypothetical protein
LNKKFSRYILVLAKHQDGHHERNENNEILFFSRINGAHFSKMIMILNWSILYIKIANEKKNTEFRFRRKIDEIQTYFGFTFLFETTKNI